MTETERKIVDSLGKAIAQMTEQEKMRLLSFGDGMLFVLDRGRDGKQEQDTEGVQS